MSDRPYRRLIMTTEQKIHPNPVRVNVLRRNASEEQLSLVQTVTLQESRNGCSSFANGPDGTVFCAILSSSTVHEIYRTRMPGSPGAQFGAVAKTHVMHRVIRLICGFQCDWQYRLAVSFDNESVQVFRVTEDGFSEFQSIESPYANWSPRTFVGLGDGAFCISAQFPDPANSKKIHTLGVWTLCRKTTVQNATVQNATVQNATVQKSQSAERHSAERS